MPKITGCSTVLAVCEKRELEITYLRSDLYRRYRYLQATAKIASVATVVCS